MSMSFRLSCVRSSVLADTLSRKNLDPSIRSVVYDTGNSSSLSSLWSFAGDERRDWDGRTLSETSCKTVYCSRVGSPQASLLSRNVLPGSQFHPLQGAVKKRRSVLTIRANAASNLSRDSQVEVLKKEEEDEEEEEELTRGQLLWRAAKLPIYSVAIVPLSVGGAAAFWQSGSFNAPQYWLMFWSSILVITWLNLSNDAYDSITGADKNKRESVVNITGSQQGVLWAARACLTVGFTGLVLGASQASDMRVAGLLFAAIACGYVYQCPPFRLGYKGLGEPLCFLAFGPLATTAFYLSQASTSGVVGLPITLTMLGLSVIVGITTSLILFCSHFHQIEGDTLAGKMSPLVRMGTEDGSKFVQGTIIGLYSLIMALTAGHALPMSCTLFSLVTLPIGKLVLDFIKNNHSNKEVIFMAKYYAVRLHVVMGVAMTLGLCLASQI